jgi:membrane protein implicated in regulation of membrane protease activity
VTNHGLLTVVAILELLAGGLVLFGVGVPYSGLLFGTVVVVSMLMGSVLLGNRSRPRERNRSRPRERNRSRPRAAKKAAPKAKRATLTVGTSTQETMIQQAWIGRPTAQARKTKSA